MAEETQGQVETSKAGKYICTKKCFHKHRLWERGEICVHDGTYIVPKHFRLMVQAEATLEDPTLKPLIMDRLDQMGVSYPANATMAELVARMLLEQDAKGNAREKVMAELDALGVKYHKNANLQNLIAKLTEAKGAGAAAAQSIEDEKADKAGGDAPKIFGVEE